MAHRCIAVILSLLIALGPAAALASASRDAHCHGQIATTHASQDAAHTTDHSTHGAPATGSLDGVALDCGCACSCATGSTCTTLAAVPTTLLFADAGGSRPDGLTDTDHALGRGPPPSPPPIESPLQR